MLKELGVNRLEDLQYLEEIAWKRGAMVRYSRLDGSEARLAVFGRRAIITVSDALSNPHRVRFSIAHELGHLELRHHGGAFNICTTADLDYLKGPETSRSVEVEANAFAATLLMPRRLFQPICGSEDPSLEFISQVARRFNVSLTSAALRYIQFCEDACAIVYSVNGRVKWFRASQAFRESRAYVETKVKLDPITQAAKGFRGLNASDPKLVPASAWLAPGKYNEDAVVVEHSRYMRRYDSTLTLLWIRDDIFEDEDDWMF